MPIDFFCVECGAGHSVPDDHAGKNAKCGCGAAVTVPMVDAKPSELRKRCLACAELIMLSAKKCRFCGHWVADAEQSLASHGPRELTQEDIMAMVLSGLIPGVGQIYKGEQERGLLWLAAVVGGTLLFVVPGLVAYVLCIMDAGGYKVLPDKKNQRPNDKPS